MSAPLPSPKPSQGTLGKRLLTTFFVVLTLTLLGSVIGIWSLRQIQQSTETMVSQGVATERLIADAYRYQAINSERYKASPFRQIQLQVIDFQRLLAKSSNRYTAGYTVAFSQFWLRKWHTHQPEEVLAPRP